MKKEFSLKWLSSRQPRKQRKYRYNAPLHRRQKMLAAHLDKALRKEYRRRSIQIRVGDEVTVMRGEYRKKSGKVSAVSMKGLKIFIDSVKRKKVSGEEKEIPIDPSNVRITKLNMDDARRKKFMKRKGIAVKAEAKPDAKREKKENETEGKAGHRDEKNADHRTASRADARAESDV
jgi:large subunit ribosomal protein L24